MAKELGIDPAAIAGTAAMGRITREDVMRAAEARKAEPPAPAPTAPPAAPPPTEDVSAAPAGPPPPEVPEAAAVSPVAGEDESVPLSPMRRRIAARLVHSRQTIPHVTTTVEVDMTAVTSLRDRHKNEYERRGVKLTYMPFILRATAEALRAFPPMNASWGGDKLILHRRIHLGVAVSVEGGLTVPVIRDADTSSVRSLAERLAQVAVRAREGKLKADEIQGSTFTITNPGIFGTVFSTPIINPPEAGILGVGRVAETPVVRDGAIVVRRMGYLFLSYDHRIVDGETAIRFLQHIRARIETADFDLA
jgi:pyruvate/2-oxoglutarate dehydrogenase complex dihydrolipoamide acyltransferase (E2) component